MLTTAWHPRRSVQVIWMNTLYIMRTSSCWSSAIPTALIFPVALVAAPTCAFVVLTILAGAISSSSSADNSLTKPVSSLAVLNSTSDWKFFTAKSHGSVANEETQLRKKIWKKWPQRKTGNIRPWGNVHGVLMSDVRETFVKQQRN